MTLYAKRKIEYFGAFKGFKKTIIKNKKGVIKAVIPAYQKQPNKNHKKIIINCIHYNLEFIN